jgi:hypothetical protein
MALPRIAACNGRSITGYAIGGLDDEPSDPTLKAIMSSCAKAPAPAVPTNANTGSRPQRCGYPRSRLIPYGKPRLGPGARKSYIHASSGSPESQPRNSLMRLKAAGSAIAPAWRLAQILRARMFKTVNHHCARSQTEPCLRPVIPLASSERASKTPDPYNRRDHEACNDQSHDQRTRS